MAALVDDNYRSAMPPRFIVDVNVGRLAKWLRAMGYDTLFVPDVDDRDLVRIAQQQERTILTRDHLLLERRAVARGQVTAVLVQGDHFHEQIGQVASALGLRLDNEFSRCIQCNAELSDLAKEETPDRVPTYVYQTQEEFKECPTCRRVYWRGTHWHNMKREIAKVRESYGA